MIDLIGCSSEYQDTQQTHTLDCKKDDEPPFILFIHQVCLCVKMCVCGTTREEEA